MRTGPLVSSKLLDKRWKQKDQEIHKKRLREVKSQVRTLQSAPYVPNPVIRNYKKDALLERRYTEIERENRILLEKMSHIMSNSNMSFNSQQQKRSLNRDLRKKDLLKITIENQAILKRLQDKNSHYSVTKWEEDFKGKEKIMKSLCDYPFILDGDPNKTRIQTAEALDYSSDQITKQQFFPRIGTASSAQRNINKSFSTAGGANESMLGGRGGKPVIKQAEALDENRIVLYKKGKQLGNGYYIVEISSNNSHLFIAAYDVESPESLLIELPEKKAQEILTEFHNDYEVMSSSLQVINKRLVLLNPKYTQQKQRLASAPAGRLPRTQENIAPSQGVIGQHQLQNDYSYKENQDPTNISLGNIRGRPETAGMPQTQL